MPANSEPIPHTPFEDAQALIIAPLLVAFAVLLFRHAGLMTGGTVGIAFLLHYATGWPMGPMVFAINLPFYLLAVRVLGWEFTLKTFISVALLAFYTEILPSLITLQALSKPFAAVMGGFLTGVGILILIRHKASLGGIGIVAVYLQQVKGWRAGVVQGMADFAVLSVAVFARDLVSVALSVAGAVALNLVIAVNHRTGRYMGV